MFKELIVKRNAFAEIDLQAIKMNYHFAQSQAPEANALAVIKANAYGHGLIEVAKALENDVPGFVVAIMAEAITLREEGIAKPILILQGAQTEDELRLAGRNDFWLCVYSEHQVELIRKTSISNPVTLWFKLDTGLHRLGLSIESLSEALKSLEGCPWVNDEQVIYSHFSSSNQLESKESGRQIDQFIDQTAALEKLEGIQREFSFANSAAVANLNKSHKQWTRPGIMLYGMPLFDSSHQSDEILEPAMSFYATVIAVREIEEGESVGYGQTWTAKRTSIIATISVGYGDGYPRHAKNGTPVYINNQRAKLVGRVSMDLLSIDVTDINEVKVGDRAELWGKNLNASEVADYSDTISYELLTGLSERVPRVYIG